MKKRRDVFFKSQDNFELPEISPKIFAYVPKIKMDDELQNPK
jgi:hypothetical protein